jgi:hypothetical protein
MLPPVSAAYICRLVLFSRPERFGQWIKYLKKQHPGRLEKTTSFGVSGICWFGELGFEKHIKEWNGGSSELSEKSVGKRRDGPLAAILEFPRLEILSLDFFWLHVNHFSKAHNVEMLKVLGDFLDLHGKGFGKGVSEIQQCKYVSKGR